MKPKMTIRKGKREEGKEKESKKIDEQMKKVKEAKKAKSTRNDLQKRREEMNGKLKKKRK
jgi:hypothetical protein